jgi:hypothetical protein
VLASRRCRTTGRLSMEHEEGTDELGDEFGEPDE